MVWAWYESPLPWLEPKLTVFLQEHVPRSRSLLPIPFRVQNRSSPISSRQKNRCPQSPTGRHNRPVKAAAKRLLPSPNMLIFMYQCRLLHIASSLDPDVKLCPAFHRLPHAHVFHFKPRNKLDPKRSLCLCGWIWKVWISSGYHDRTGSR